MSTTRLLNPPPLRSRRTLGGLDCAVTLASVRDEYNLDDRALALAAIEAGSS